MNDSQLHYMQLPREILIGTNVLERTGETCLRLGHSSSALIVTGPKVRSVAAGKVVASLEKSGFDTHQAIVKNATKQQVELVTREIEAARPKVVLGVGGGKDIDVAKMASARASLGFLSVPTAASHDGIGSPLVSIRGYETPYSFKAQAPEAIIADLQTIASSPPRLLRSGCGDIIAKYTAVRDWKLAHRVKNEYYGAYAAELALMSARMVMQAAAIIGARSLEGVRTVVEALISCGVAMSIAGSSRPCSGAEHMFSHTLSELAPNRALHGELCGVGTIMTAYLHGGDWELIRRVLRTIGAPTTSRELGISGKDIVEALSTAHKIRPERYTILGELGVTREAAVKVAKATGVIS